MCCISTASSTAISRHGCEVALVAFLSSEYSSCHGSVFFTPDSFGVAGFYVASDPFARRPVRPSSTRSRDSRDKPSSTNRLKGATKFHPQEQEDQQISRPEAHPLIFVHKPGGLMANQQQRGTIIAHILLDRCIFWLALAALRMPK